jgi:RNA polymerase sigma-70 factor, ECF subfamily
LEQLQPFERAVFLLREVFEYDFAEIAGILGKSEAACRRSFNRARPHLREHRPRFPASRQTQQQLLDGYMRAVETGEMTTLMSLLAKDVLLWTDGGGKIKAAALNPVSGREAVARFSMGTKRNWPPDYHAERAEVNGHPAMLLYAGATIFAVLAVAVEGEQIRAIHVIANPEKLAHL